MRLTAVFGAFGLTAMIGAGASAQSLACGGEYTIQRGDTLQKVTRMAYGEGLSWKYIYNANKGVVGPNPSLIEVGMVLRVPCRKGQTAGATTTTSTASTTSSSAAAATAVAAATATSAAAPAAARSRPNSMLRLVTATNYAPFHDQDAERGGMITEITWAALATVMEQDQYRIDFINDWSAHINPLLKDQAYDFGLSWFRPNCDVIDKLSEDNRFRCESLEFSDPLFEQIVGYYTLIDNELTPTTPSDLLGSVICRPAGYSTFMLEEFDLIEPNVTMKKPSGPDDCFEMLANKEADYVVLASTVADNTIASMNMRDRFKELPELAYIATLHAITSIDNPNKDAQIATLNEGIQKVRESGAWFEIVQRHLIAHTQKTATN